MTYTIRQHQNEYEEATLEKCVADFLKTLDKVEVSESGVEFRPNSISSCRVLDQMRFGDILNRMREIIAIEKLKVDIRSYGATETVSETYTKE